MASGFSYVQINQSTSVQGDHRSGSKLVLTADVIACQTKPNDGGVGTRMSTDAAEVITTPNPRPPATSCSLSSLSIPVRRTREVNYFLYKSFSFKYFSMWENWNFRRHKRNASFITYYTLLVVLKLCFGNFVLPHFLWKPGTIIILLL
jgi:hypothetical protein